MVSEASKVAWESTSLTRIESGHERKRVGNALAERASTLTHDLLRAGKEDLAVELGMTTTYLFHIGEHYAQVLDSVQAMKDRIKGTRFEPDMEYYVDWAKSEMEDPDTSKKSGRLAALYTLVWEKRVIGTMEAVQEMASRFGKPVSNSTVNAYSRILHEERRICRLGGPTGFRIEMFPNIRRALSRQSSYGKKAFFAGQLRERGPSTFKRQWDVDVSQRRVFEIENGNDPRAFAILTPELKYREARMVGESIANGGYGVSGELHPLHDMPDFGFEPVQDLQMADFLVDCSVWGEKGKWRDEWTRNEGLP
ncbi:MAG: hypothetical protein LN416_04895 [Candidatus Thermoplasmatota archaeon]|nr:hypothetical protein [Candidatus Thermoplasmatota archaeon]